MRGADPIGEKQRQRAGGGLVDDDAPRLVVREQGEQIGRSVVLDDAGRRLHVAEQDEPNAEVASETVEGGAFGPVAGDHDEEARLVRLCSGADERVEPLLGREPGNREHDDVVVTGADGGAEGRAARDEPIGQLDVGLDVDRVREAAGAARGCAAGEHGVACQRPDRQHPGRATHDRRHDEPLHDAPPGRPRVAIVALDEQHVRNAAAAAPEHGGL